MVIADNIIIDIILFLLILLIRNFIMFGIISRLMILFLVITVNSISDVILFI